jgi:hypothetical protein
MTNPPLEPLTCEAALERLDSVWLDPLPEEPCAAELLAAREHLQECSTCWAEWQRRRAADQRIAALMQAVPVPSGLREQLLAATAADAQRVTPAEDDDLRRHRQLHRRAWWISAAAMLLIVCAGGSWLWQRLHPQRVSLQTLTDATPLEASELIEADATKLPPLPATWQRTRGLRTANMAHAFTLPGTRATAGWIAFELRTSRTSVIQGVLLMAPQANVSDPPPPWLLRPTWTRYTQRGGKPVSVAGWTERGVVYLCFVPGAPGLLDRVLQATAPTAA